MDYRRIIKSIEELEADNRKFRERVNQLDNQVVEKKKLEETEAEARERRANQREAHLALRASLCEKDMAAKRLKSQLREIEMDTNASISTEEPKVKMVRIEWPIEEPSKTTSTTASKEGVPPLVVESNH